MPSERDHGRIPRAAAACAIAMARNLLASARRSGFHVEHPSDRARAWAMRVLEDGHHVVEDYLPVDECRHIIDEIERLFAAHPELVRSHSDRRLFGVDTRSEAIRRFADDAELLSVASEVSGAECRNFSTLGARLDYTPGNLGSGESWHRDALSPQFKAIVYLTDVSEDDGPFQLVLESERLIRTLNDIWVAGLQPDQQRLTEREVERLTRDPERLKTFTGRAGTLILVNAGAIHRGCPIRKGTRYALTNYYYRNSEITPASEARFGPRLV
jgi:hypothetical protein